MEWRKIFSQIFGHTRQEWRNIHDFIKVFFTKCLFFGTEFKKSWKFLPWKFGAIRYAQTSLQVLRDISLTKRWIPDPYLPSSALHVPDCLSFDFTWLAKPVLEKQTSQHCSQPVSQSYHSMLLNKWVAIMLLACTTIVNLIDLIFNLTWLP